MSLFPQFYELCESISHLDSNIQSVTVINKYGRIVEKISNEKNDKHIPCNDEMFFMQCVLQISMGQDFDDKFGPINYHLSERENLTMLTFPLYGHVLLVTTKKNVSPISLARKIVHVTAGYGKQTITS